MDYVKVLEGLKGGERLVQQTAPSKSGQNRDKNKNNGGKGNNQMPAMGGMGAMPGMGGRR